MTDIVRSREENTEGTGGLSGEGELFEYVNGGSESPVLYVSDLVDYFHLNIFKFKIIMANWRADYNRCVKRTNCCRSRR